MLRCTIFVLLSYSLLATCCARILRPDPQHDAAITVDSDPGGNSTDYTMKRTEWGEEKRDWAVTRVARAIGGGTVEDDVVGIVEDTSRKKKDKGYENVLLCFMGAAKMMMLYVMMNGVAAIAGKALIVGKVALAIATAIALYKASEHEKVSYQVVKHPYYTYEHIHSSSLDLEHDLGENDIHYRSRRRIYPYF